MFKRGGDIKETLGVGSFAPMVKELKEDLNGYFIERENTWKIWSNHSNHYDGPASIKVIEWKSFPGGSNNICKLVALFQPENPVEFKGFVRAGIHNAKEIFSKRACKFTCVNFYAAQKKFKEFEFELAKGRIIVEFVYSRNKK